MENVLNFMFDTRLIHSNIKPTAQIDSAKRKFGML